MNLFKKILSVIMSVIMVFTLIPTVIAADPVTQSSGTFKCAWFNETLTYPYEYSDEYFSVSPFDYSNDLAQFALCTAMASFNSFDREHGDEHVAAFLNECGFEVKSYGYETEGYDTVAVAFGRKEINGCTVVVAAVRSGNYGMEWGGNLRVGSGTGDHEGFEIAKNTALLYLNKYFEENPCIGKVKLLIPGYSRGASIANLMAAALDDGTYKDVLGEEKDNIINTDIKELYAYAFEAPQCTTNTKAHDEIYANIFNIVNPNDYVPMFVMDEWGFTNYGVRIEMPCADNCDNYNSYYDRVCAEFDSFMGENDRKAKDCFYSKEDSKSAEATLRYIFSGLADEVMTDREFFHENYEAPIVFFAGQYLGRKRKAKDFARTMGLIGIGTAVCIKPENIEKIRSEGYRRYLSEYLAKKNGGELTDKEIEGTLNLITSLLEFLSRNRRDVMSLLGQLNTVLQVHQPFVALAWIRTLNDEDIRSVNGDLNSVLRLSCTSMTLNYNVNGRLTARFDSSLGHVKWESADSSIASVSENGVVHGSGRGTTTVTATLYSDSGEKLAQAQTEVTIHMNAMQVMVSLIKGIVKR